MKGVGGHLFAAAWILLLSGLSLSLAQADCGNIQADAGNYGPFDYLDPNVRTQKLPIVENRHLTPPIESLTANMSTRILASNIDYALRKSPNHHRALDAMSRLAVRENTEKVEGATYSVRCYFQRALVFQPRDGTARMLYGVHLKRLGRMNDALEHMKAGLDMQPDNAMIQYNLGLLYLEMEDYENAREYAMQAYAAGFPDGELRAGLKAAGYWGED